VKPLNQTGFEVEMPLNAVIHARVFDAKLRVTDPLGIAVSGARISATLVNGTTIVGGTSSDGMFIIPMIPVGTFTATISNLGITTEINANATTQSIIQAQVPLSYPTIEIVVAEIAIVAILAILSRRKRIFHKSTKQLGLV
jgi:phosphatidate phosphatase APP1